MKQKHVFKLLTILLVITAVATVFTACPPQGPTEQTNITETTTTTGPKVIDMVNNAGPTALLAEFKYEQKITYHEIRLKTTVNISNYYNALKNLNSKFGADLWGYFIIAIDRKDVNYGANALKVGNYPVYFADPDFRVDAVIRSASPSGETPNTNDGVPFKAEYGNVLLDVLTNAVTGIDYWWDYSHVELKFQGKQGEISNNTVSGNDAVATSLKLDDGKTVYIDESTFSYDSSTGEYVFRIPFSVIPEDAIQKVAVFAMQNAGWRRSADSSETNQLDAVVKPIGAGDVSLVYANPVSGKYENIPVIDLSSGQAITGPLQTTEPVPPATVSLDKSIYDAILSPAEVFVTVVDPDAGKNTLQVRVITPSTNITLTVYSTNAGKTVFTNSFTVGRAGSGADLEFSANGTITVAYDDPTYQGYTATASASVFVEAPAGLLIDRSGDQVGGASCGMDILYVKVTNDATKLHIEVYVAGNKNWDQNIFVFIDSKTGGATIFTNNPPNPWGNKDIILANGAADIGVFGWAKEDGFSAYNFVDNDTTGTDNGNVTVTFDTSSENQLYMTIEIPLADLGVSANDTVKIIVVENDWDGTKNNCVNDVAPDPSTAPVGGPNGDVLDNWFEYTIK